VKKKYYFHSSNHIIIPIIILIILFPTIQAHITINIIEEKHDNLVLLTGFGPFLTHEINPSEIVATTLNNTNYQNFTIKGYVLPVNYTTAPQLMKSLIQKYDPTLIISLGLAPGATTIRVETLCYNLRIEPEKNYPLLTLKKVNTAGPMIQKTTFDVDRTVNKIKEKNIPVEQSYYPGFYLCNAILYETLLYQSRKNESRPTGFIHIPLLDSQNPYGMILDTIILTVHAILDTYSTCGALQ
jgi:pyroglutamyl-peptidase